ncbi:hypothetical protein CVT26_005513 [Gymnopilus dilepis]|uniref:DUF4219 domain-containing protein n=1 Tax=Gymnopilus dilepis TaxID=231916 RepID=A0A409WYW2_9AGAR|nr:hypothetical protein CVT26_005513 [Gymnopilus dilepis]
MASTECPVLTGPENFQIWHIRILAKLRVEKVADVILAKGKEEDEGADDPDTTVVPYYRESWATRDSKAHGILITHLSDRLSLQVANLPSALEVYNKILEIHQKTNVGVSAFYTFVGMMNLKWDGDISTIQDHIASISAADAKLTAMKKGVDSEWLAFILLQSLPNTTVWETFKTSVLHSMPTDSKLSFSELSNRLTFEAARIQGSTEASESALKAKAAKPSSKPRSDKWWQGAAEEGKGQGSEKG